MKNKKILVVGTLPSSNPKSIGGANIVIKNVAEHLEEKKVSFDFFSVRRTWIKFGLFFDSFYKLPQLLYKVSQYDIISIHATRDITLLLSPLVVPLAKRLNKKIIYHVLAGSFHNTFKEVPEPFQKIIINQVFNKSSLIFFETKFLVNHFSSKTTSIVDWLPNTRKRTRFDYSSPNIYRKRFVFISRVTLTKGIQIAIQVFAKLPEDFHLDIFGPVAKDCEELVNQPHKNVTYKGLLNPNEVSLSLKQYDFLLLPTFHPGEGYPGIILEALEVGIPVITTNWNAIPEIISNNRNGKLVQPKNVDDLYHTILNLSEEEHQALSKNAFNSFGEFDREVVYKKLTDAYS